MANIPTDGEASYLSASGGLYAVADAEFRNMLGTETPDPSDPSTTYPKLTPDYVEVDGAIRTVVRNGNVTTETMKIDAATGDITCHSITTSSAREKKTNIEEFTEDALKIINDTKIVTFKYKTENEEALEHVGFIANDTNPILSDKDQRHFRIGDSIGVLMKAVQELSARNKELEQKINELTNK